MNIGHEKVYVFDTILDKEEHRINEIKHRLIESMQNETWIYREKDTERWGRERDRQTDRNINVMKKSNSLRDM